MAEDIGITESDGTVNEKLLKENLIFTDAKVSDPIQSAMTADVASLWFGAAPPDLSLEVSVRGADWIYTYLRSFYQDTKRPFGTNNLVYPDVAMPNVLAVLQGSQIPAYRYRMENGDGSAKKVEFIDHLVLEKEGMMSEAEFDSAVADLVNFLAYASTPEKIERQRIGYGVLGFLFIFAISAFLLKREYWKDVKK